MLRDRILKHRTTHYHELLLSDDDIWLQTFERMLGDASPPTIGIVIQLMGEIDLITNWAKPTFII